MELSPEDALRLNVLLANPLLAVRIDEGRLAVHALTPEGETAIPLHPNCREEQYLKRVRELLSTHVLGSPGGYPVFLKRWTRMGQARDESLEKLLLLGEPEAVVAVVHAKGLTDELARRAWWAMPTADNARRMLERPAVAQGRMGKVLAEFLLEFLPFEESPQAMIESVRLVLQPGLISEEARAKLWARGRSRNAYYVGFLQAVPDALPLEKPAHPALEVLQPQIAPLAGENPFAAQLLRVLQPAGQAWLATAETVMKKPSNQDVVVELMEALRAYFAPVAAEGARLSSIEAVLEQADARLAQGREPALAALLDRLPAAHHDLVRAMLILSAAGERLVAPIFARTDAIGSVMRRKIAPVTEPLFEQLARLQGR
ncbi:MAG: hypothetical protein D6721_08740 [Gammaproteobacteria bacterium]|nr:MAG: hypothetical protein D6721_08740 [Gammaproteobacteria bacterium]